jgi:hypothetical protein
LAVFTDCADVLPVIVRLPSKIPDEFAKALFALLYAACVKILAAAIFEVILPQPIASLI